MKKDLLKVSIRQNAIYLPPVEGMGEEEADFDNGGFGSSIA